MGAESGLYLHLVRDEQWFVAQFQAIATRICLQAGHSCIIEDEYIARAHKRWVKRCQSSEYRVSPPEPNFHYRLIGWLCFHLVTDDFPLLMPSIRPGDREIEKILKQFPNIFLSIAVCTEILHNIEIEIGRAKPGSFQKPKMDTLYSACSNISDDARQAVHFMQILMGDYAEPTSFL